MSLRAARQKVPWIPVKVRLVKRILFEQRGVFSRLWKVSGGSREKIVGRDTARTFNALDQKVLESRPRSFRCLLFLAKAVHTLLYSGAIRLRLHDFGVQTIM